MSWTASYDQRPWVRLYQGAVKPSLDYPDIPLYRFLEDSAVEFPEHPAALFFGRPLLYRDLKQQVDRFAGALARLGVRKGDRVALMFPNCPQAVIAYYGALRLGAVVVQLSPIASARELAFQLEDSGARILATVDAVAGHTGRLLDEGRLDHLIVGRISDYLPGVLRILYPLKARREGQPPPPSGPQVYDWQSLLAGAPPPPPVDIDPHEDLALIQYTGGTTGTPKGAMLTHRNLVCNTLQAVAWFPGLERGRERILAVLPFFHVYGMTVCMNFAMATAATLLLLPRFDLDSVLKTINRYRPTLFPGAPTMYVAINNHPHVQRHDLRSIRACISGAAPLPVEVRERFEALTGGQLVEGYGLTEASPVTHCNPFWGEVRAGSIGLPFPDTDCRIVDPETGEDVPLGQPGELLIRGPQVMKGYWNRPEENARALRDGWLYTGDVARMDEDGYFYIVDRLKEIIIAGGFNIYPREVEEVLYEHPAVKEAAVIGVPDPYRGETVKAFVVLKPGARATADDIIAFCREHLARYKVPTHVEFRDDLPKSLVGKVLRRVLAEEEAAKRAQTGA
ncbi:MAG: long-chain fatty acid--CoA ligase [Thermaerobacter sp.]